MFKKVLIANRGEIAVRIVRTCREMGIPSVAVFSEADRGSLHVKLADEAVCVGPPAASQSYLNVPNIISSAEITGCDAIHPGYGFLSENEDFAEICAECGLTFIGPPPRSIALMGNKSEARKTMQAAGVPTVPGSDGVLTGGAKQAKELADGMGYPVLLKASAGGGGKGMRVVREPGELEALHNMAQMEAQAAFGNGDLYLEKYLTRARHIEVQIMADAHGNSIHLGERECSIQRRHQKLLEESPSPALTAEDRERLGGWALKAVEAAGYRNAGTVEFIMAGPGEFYFMEMNTRLQVEHPVTERVTGLDLVKLQLKVASGDPLPFKQKDVRFTGHAMEFRINAEDPDNGFAPSPGKLSMFEAPLGPFVRVDTYANTGCTVQPYYDSLVAKIIVWGADRRETIARARRCLKEFTVEGIKTTIPLHLKILESKRFAAGDLSTRFLEEEFGL